MVFSKLEFVDLCLNFYILDLCLFGIFRFVIYFFLNIFQGFLNEFLDYFFWIFVIAVTNKRVEIIFFSLKWVGNNRSFSGKLV